LSRRQARISRWRKLHIAARLAGDNFRVWIVDEQGIEDRNAIIAYVPEKAVECAS
jgi:hypothetical protein